MQQRNPRAPVNRVWSRLPGANYARWLTLSMIAAFAALSVAACGGETTGGVSPEALIAEACDRMVELGCLTKSECEEAVNLARADFADRGCRAEYDAAIGCLGARVSSCSEVLDDVCPAEAAAALSCHNRTEDCSGGLTDGTRCSVQCEAYSAECYTLANSQFVCYCRQGPEVGTEFEADCESLAEDAKRECQ